MSDITSEQCLGARAMLRMTRNELAEASQVAVATLADFESGKRSPHPRTIAAIRSALETAGVEFIGETGVRLLGPASKALRKREAEKQAQRETEDPYIPEVKFTPRDGGDLKAPSAPPSVSQGDKEK